MIDIDKLKELIDDEPHRDIDCYDGLISSLYPDFGYIEDYMSDDMYNPYWDRFKTVDAIKWICWDTPVGLSVILLDDEIVGFKFQQFRKSDPEFHWASDAAQDKVVSVLRKMIDMYVANSSNEGEVVPDISDFFESINTYVKENELTSSKFNAMSGNITKNIMDKL